MFCNMRDHLLETLRAHTPCGLVYGTGDMLLVTQGYVRELNRTAESRRLLEVMEKAAA